MGTRVPKAGSAYMFTYVAVGEAMAFVIGWNMLLEYVIGSAGVARGLSGYFNFVSGGKLIPFFIDTMPMDVSFLSPYCDPLSAGIVLIITVILMIGVKESATFTKVFTGLNLLVLAYVCISGSFKDNPENWSIPRDRVPQTGCGDPETETPDSCGIGGFAPYGVSGVISGAATAFYCFIGFDCIATTGEEVKNPKRSFPLSILASLTIMCVFYTGTAVTVTMIVPYYQLDDAAPLTKAFDDIGWHVAVYIISLGAFGALSTSLLGSMFPMPRVVMSMARDGLLFRFLARIHPKRKTPVWATLFSGIVAEIAGPCRRYEREDADDKRPDASPTVSRRLSVLLFPPGNAMTDFSLKVVRVLTFLNVIFVVGISALITLQQWWRGRLGFGILETAWGITIFVALVLALLLSLFVTWRQPQSSKKLSFRVPLVPLLPTAAIFFNIFLMLQLDGLTWIRLVVWMALGAIIYLSYGIRHSSEEAGTRHTTEMTCSPNGVLERATPEDSIQSS